MKLSQFLSAFGEPPFEGDGWLAHCPAHGDSHRSLRIAVDPSNGNALLSCRAGCKTPEVVEASPLSWPDFFDLEIDVEGARSVSDGSTPVDAPTQARMALYLRRASENLSEEALAYARSRFGVNRGLAEDLGLGYDPGGQAVHEFDFLGRAYTDAPRLVVPFRDAEGIPRGFQSRDISPEQRAKAKWSGPSNPLGGGSWTRTAYFESGSGIDLIVVTEGPGDALTTVAAGVDAVGIRGVSHAPAVVEELAQTLRGRRVVLAGDNDRAGEGMNTKLGQALTEVGLSVSLLEFPDDVEDISAWYESDPERFASVFQRAVATAPAFIPLVTVTSNEDDEAEEAEDLASHVGIAREVAQRFDGLLYAEGLGFFVFDGGVWVRDRHQTVRSSIHLISDQFQAEGDRLQSEGRTDDAGRYWAAARRCRSTTFIDNVIKELKALVPVDQEDFDQHHHLLAFTNGVVDLRTGELLPHSADFMLTRRLDFAYDSEARADRWVRFLAEIMPGSPEMVDYLQRLVGYGITGSTVEQCFAVLWGKGANGKSVFTDTLSYVFEDVTVTTPFATFEDRPSGGIPNDLAALRGSRLVFASEGDRGKPMAESIIKRITGQDLVTARFMRQEFFSFRPTFLIMMGTNFKPSFRGQDEGLWRRVKLIPFRRFFAPEERDHYLTQKLRDEAQGIAAWAVQGAVAWHRDGLSDPPSVQEATTNYRATADALSGFYPDGPLAEGTPTDFVLGSDAYKLYEQWCDEEELPLKERWSRRAFYDGMEERGAERLKKKQGICLFGVKKAETPSTPEAPPRDTSTRTNESIFDGAR